MNKHERQGLGLTLEPFDRCFKHGYARRGWHAFFGIGWPWRRSDRGMSGSTMNYFMAHQRPWPEAFVEEENARLRNQLAAALEVARNLGFHVSELEDLKTELFGREDFEDRMRRGLKEDGIEKGEEYWSAWTDKVQRLKLAVEALETV